MHHDLVGQLQLSLGRGLLGLGYGAGCGHHDLVDQLQLLLVRGFSRVIHSGNQIQLGE